MAYMQDVANLTDCSSSHRRLGWRREWPSHGRQAPFGACSSLWTCTIYPAAQPGRLRSWRPTPPGAICWPTAPISGRGIALPARLLLPARTAAAARGPGRPGRHQAADRRRLRRPRLRRPAGLGAHAPGQRDRDNESQSRVTASSTATVPTSSQNGARPISSRSTARGSWFSTRPWAGLPGQARVGRRRARARAC
jgi:hypothetical protein